MRSRFKVFLGCAMGTSERARDSGSRRIPRPMTRYPRAILGCSRHTSRSQPARRVALSIVNLHRVSVFQPFITFFSGAPWARPDEPATPDRGKYLVR